MALSNAAKDIVIKIRADDAQYQAALKKTDASTAAFAFKMAGYGKTAALAIGSMAVALTGFSVNAAADYEQLERGFRSLTASQGKDADEYIRKLKEATRGTASQAALLGQANKAMLLGLDVDTLVEMAEGAAVIAQATGQSSDYLFESLALGVGRQSRLLLDNLGIIVDTEKAYENYAKSLGKTTSELTEQEQKTAFLQAAMDGLNERVDSLGGFAEDTKSNVAELKANLNDLAVDIGNNFLPAVNNVIKGINDWGDAGGWDKISQSAADGTTRMRLYAEAVKDFIGTVKDSAPVQNFSDYLNALWDATSGGPNVLNLRDEIDKILTEKYPDIAGSLKMDWNPLENPMTQDLAKFITENSKVVEDNSKAVEENTRAQTKYQAMLYDRHVASLERGNEGIDARFGYTVESTETYQNDYSKYMANKSGA